MPPELTKKQGEFLELLERWLARRGRAPSLREAAKELGVSHSAVAQLFRALEGKGYLRRAGRYSRRVHLLNRAGETRAMQRGREVPIIGRIAAGLPLYAQQEWEEALVVDGTVFRGANLFALRVKGDSMTGAGIRDGDVAICEPRQYAQDGEIVVVLINDEEATVKRFFLKKDKIELRPANKAYQSRFYSFGEVLIQGKVIGLQRGPEQMAGL